MSLDIIKNLDSFSGVGKNQTATVTLAGGVVYDEIHLEFNQDANFTRDKITSIRLNLNAEDIIEVSLEELDMINQYRDEKHAVTSGFAAICLKEIIAKSYEGSNAYGLITSGADAISLEVDIGDTGATSPTLKAFAVTRARPTDAAGRLIPRLYIPKIRKFTNNASAGGKFEISTLPRRPDVRFKRVHFVGANITGLAVERDQIKLHDTTKARNEYILKRYGRVPQTDHYHFDPVMDGYVLKKLFPTLSNSLVFTLDMSAAGQCDAIVESVWQERNPR